MSQALIGSRRTQFVGAGVGGGPVIPKMIAKDCVPAAGDQDPAGTTFSAAPPTFARPPTSTTVARRSHSRGATAAGGSTTFLPAQSIPLSLPRTDVPYPVKLASIVSGLWASVLEEFPTLVTSRPSARDVQHLTAAISSPQRHTGLPALQAASPPQGVAASGQSVPPKGAPDFATSMPPHAATRPIVVVSIDHPAMNVNDIVSLIALSSASLEALAFVLVPYQLHRLARMSQHASAALAPGCHEDDKPCAVPARSLDDSDSMPLVEPGGTAAAADHHAFTERGAAFGDGESGGAASARGGPTGLPPLPPAPPRPTFRIYQAHICRLFICLVTLCHKAHGDYGFTQAFFKTLLPSDWTPSTSQVLQTSGLLSGRNRHVLPAATPDAPPPAFGVHSMDGESLVSLEWDVCNALQFNFVSDPVHFSEWLRRRLPMEDLRFVTAVNHVHDHAEAQRSARRFR